MEENPYLRRRVKKQHGQSAEQRVAKRLGGQQTPASGAMVGAKGDIRKGAFLIESKATVARSLVLQQAWLEKISKEALDVGKTPALIVQFVDAGGRCKARGGWVLVPEHVFAELAE